MFPWLTSLRKSLRQTSSPSTRRVRNGRPTGQASLERLEQRTLLSGVAGAAPTEGVDVAIEFDSGETNLEYIHGYGYETSFSLIVSNVGTVDVGAAVVRLNLDQYFGHANWYVETTGDAWSSANELARKRSIEDDPNPRNREVENFEELLTLPVGSSARYIISAVNRSTNFRGWIDAPEQTGNFTMVASVSTPGLVDVNPQNNTVSESRSVSLASIGGTGLFEKTDFDGGNPEVSSTHLYFNDFNNDSIFDALTVTTLTPPEDSSASAQEFVQILEGNGEGEFNNVLDSINIDEPIRGVAVADFDRDHDLDIYVSGTTKDSIWLRGSDGEYHRQGPWMTLGNYTADVVVGDLNGDGYVDAFTAVHSETGRNLIWLGDGTGTFTPLTEETGTLYNWTGSKELKLGDVDGDNDLDAVVSEVGVKDRIWANDGQGRFEVMQAIDSPSRATSSNLLHDLDRDGDLDLAIGRKSTLGDSFEIYLNNSRGRFTKSAKSYASANYVYDMTAADLNFDGNQDLAILRANPETEEVWTEVWFNQSNGTFYDTEQRLGLGPDTGSGEVAITRFEPVNQYSAFSARSDLFVAHGFGRENEGWANTNAGESRPSSSIHDDGLEGFLVSNPDSTSVITVEDDRYHYGTTQNVHIDNSGYTGLSTVIYDREGEAWMNPYEVAAKAKFHAGADRWQDAFLIFDYVSEDDFKYAGTFAGQNKWIIGHYEGNWTNWVAEVDWDEEGRTIDAETAYELRVAIIGQEVHLSVDGVYILEGKFDGPLHYNKVGFGSFNAVTTFGDFTFGTYNSKVPSYQLGTPLYPTNYDHLIRQGEGDWTELAQEQEQSSDRGPFQYDGSGSRGLGIAFYEYDRSIPPEVNISVGIESVSGPDRWQNGFLVFDYHSPTDFKYAGFFAGQNQWVIGHYQGNWSNRLAQVDMDDYGTRIDADRSHGIELNINHNHVEFLADNAVVAAVTFDTNVNQGRLGYAADNATTKFSSIAVHRDPQLPSFSTNDRFSYHGYRFRESTNGNWATVDTGDRTVYRTNTSVNGELAYSFMPIAGVHRRPLVISVDAKSIQTTQGWQNAFVIFDFAGPNDFKYAGMFTGQNKWVIGHYQGNWGNRVAELDWDDVGREIHSNDFYQLQVRLEGSRAWLAVDGEFLLEGEFDVPVDRNAVGLAAQSAFTWFDNFSVGHEFDVYPFDLPISEDFNDGIADDFKFFNGAAWHVGGTGTEQYLQYNGTEDPVGYGLAARLSFGPLPEQIQIKATLSSQDPLTEGQGVFITYDVLSPDNYRFAGMLPEANQWVIGQYFNGRMYIKNTFIAGSEGLIEINAKQEYDVQLELNYDFGVREAKLYVDGQLIGISEGEDFSAEYEGVPSVGLAAMGTTARFDDFEFTSLVEPPPSPPLPYLQDFEAEDGVFPYLSYHNYRLWRQVGNSQNEYLLFSGRPQNEVDTATVPIENSASDPLEISADIRLGAHDDDPSSWQNGFIIFDYNSPYDFKYAGMFGVQNQWVIGHYHENWGNRYAEVDWDAVGRDIVPGQFYAVSVLIDGGRVELRADGELITVADFSRPVDKGSVGIGAYNTRTAFDNLSIQTLSPATAPVDNLFAAWDEESSALLI